MTTGSQNTFSQPQLSLTPGRIITKIKRYNLPSGKVHEIRKVITTVQDNQGIWRTEEFTDADSLDDGSILTEKNGDKLHDCIICGGSTVQEYQCPECCEWVHMTCTEEHKDRRICKNCAWQLKHPNLNRLHKFIWGL
jgi:hypothetical protein